MNAYTLRLCREVVDALGGYTADDELRVLILSGAGLFRRVMGMDKALRMSLLNEVYSAEEALRLGLVTEVVPADQLEKRTMELARDLARRAPIAVRLAKHLMLRGQETTFEQSLADAALAVMISNDTEDVHEGIRAFIE